MTGSGDKYRRGHHCVFFTQYHIIFCPKFRFSVLKGDAAETLKEILGEICTEYDYVIKALEVMQDHVHLFVSCPKTAAPSDIARTLRSRSAIMMFRQFPGLKRFCSCCGALWSRGYFISWTRAVLANGRFVAVQCAGEDGDSHCDGSMRQFLAAV